MTSVTDMLLQTVLTDNPSNHLPYHNNQHMIGVWNVAVICAGDITPQDSTALMIASLLHDWGHSGGAQTDDVNIDVAVAKAMHLCNVIDFGDLNEHREYITNETIAAIYCTEFPFVSEPVSQIQKAIRDADMLQAIMSKDPRVIMEGLRVEINNNRPIDSQIDYRSMLEQQRTFYANMRFYTQMGQELFNNNADAYLKILEGYINKVEVIEKEARASFERIYASAEEGIKKEELWIVFREGWYEAVISI